MYDPRTLVRVKGLATGVVEMEDGNPVLGVIKVTTPSGDAVNLALVPEQVDGLTSMLASLACDLMLRDG